MSLDFCAATWKKIADLPEPFLPATIAWSARNARWYSAVSTKYFSNLLDSYSAEDDPISISFSIDRGPRWLTFARS